MNRIEKLFEEKKSSILNIYFTAGFPNLTDTVTIIKSLEENGVDLIELGIPYSDPLADGTTIQESGNIAIGNGMSLKVLFEQLKDLRKESQIPIILMGYLNQVMQFGVEKFIKKCKEVDIDGLILPDLPVDVYEAEFKSLISSNDLSISFLVTPQTSDERIEQIDANSSGFVYVVSDSSITGGKSGISSQQIEYFKRLNNKSWKNPRLIGFGISDAQTFNTACTYANGAIIGSAFIKALKKGGDDVTQTCKTFVESIRN